MGTTPPLEPQLLLSQDSKPFSIVVFACPLQLIFTKTRHSELSRKKGSFVRRRRAARVGQARWR